MSIPSQSAIVFCNPSFWPHVGGIENWILQVGRRLVSHCRVGVVTQRSDDSWPADEEIEGIRVMRYRTPGWVPGRVRPVADARSIVFGFRRLAGSARTSVFNFVDPRADQVRAARWMRRAGATSVICSLGGTASERAPVADKRRAAQVADSVVAISGYAVTAFGAPHGRVSICYPTGPLPHDFDHRASSFDRRQVLTVCRVHPRKNLEAVVEAAHRCPDLTFVIAGDYTLHSDYHQLLEQRARALGVTNLRFVGNTIGEPLARLYRESSVFFLPTHHEMFGLVFGEAMSYGLPVVAPAHTGIPEAVGDGTGLLYEAGDLGAALNGIRELTRSRQRWQECGNAAKEFMRRRFNDDFIGRYADLLLAAARGEVPCQ